MHHARCRTSHFASPQSSSTPDAATHLNQVGDNLAAAIGSTKCTLESQLGLPPSLAISQRQLPGV